MISFVGFSSFSYMFHMFHICVLYKTLVFVEIGYSALQVCVVRQCFVGAFFDYLCDFSEEVHLSF